MSKRICWQVLMIVFFLSLILFVFQNAGISKEKKEVQDRSDIIEIDLPHIPDGEEMHKVTFYHDLHTEHVNSQSMKTKNDCSVCHIKNKGAYVFKFNRIKDSDTKTDMAIYHTNCIECHDRNHKMDDATGPLEGECRSCHTKKPKLSSSLTPVTFDKSLHYRHESSKNILPANSNNNNDIGKETTNCSACHHKYNEKTKKTYYTKGEEESCNYCHKTKKENGVSSIKTASHNLCVACHVTMKTTSPEKLTGPVECQGCHDKKIFGKIKRLKNVPRLKRNQPDLTLITNADFAGQSLEMVEKVVKKSMSSVPFNHQVHEKNLNNCTICHHASLNRCNECHTLNGDKKGNQITLEQVMHKKDSDRSCTSCHNSFQIKPACAGCHFQMPEKTFAENKCNSCHLKSTEDIDPQILVTKDMKMQSDFALEKMDDYKESFKRISKDKIPEKITIGHLSNEYKPSEFPHARIIESLKKGIQKNSMAMWSHGDDKTLCMGCHHNSPANEKVQACNSCHGSKQNSDNFKPGLKAAYHGQCITCHEKMNMNKIAATDCNKCHTKKN